MQLASSQEKEFLLSDMWVPPTDIQVGGRHVLVVVRGADYETDLRALRSYIKEVNPVFIGVDDGADALLEQGYKPNIIIGDVCMVSDKALTSGAQIIAQAEQFADSAAAERAKELGLEVDTWDIAATSEDMALLLAYHSNASLIVTVGTHANLIEYREKGEAELTSTFLVHMKVAEKLVDAKGVGKLYRSAPSPASIGIVVAAALVTMIVIFAISPQLRASLELIGLALKRALGA